MKFVLKKDGKFEIFEIKKLEKYINVNLEKGIEISNQDLLSMLEHSWICKGSSNYYISSIDIYDNLLKLLDNQKAYKTMERIERHTWDKEIKRREKINDEYNALVNIKSTEVSAENANMNPQTPAGQMMKFASINSNDYANKSLLFYEFSHAHTNRDIHIHDKDYYITKSTTCMHHPMDKILKEGFKFGHGSCRPAKRIETASILMCISLETSQNEQHK